MWDLKNKNRLSGAVLLHQEGFTLFEVLVSLAIVAIVLVGVYQLQSQTLMLNMSARFSTIAPQLAQRRLAEIEQTPLNELADAAGDFGESFQGYTWQVSIGDVDSESLKDYSENLKKIDLTVSYHDENQFQLRAYRFFRD